MQSTATLGTIVTSGIDFPPIKLRPEESDESGFVLPIDIRSRKIKGGGSDNNAQRVDGDFVYIKKPHFSSYLNEENEFGYVGDFSLFSISTTGHGILLNDHSGFIEIVKIKEHYYTIICSDKEADIGKNLCSLALGKLPESYDQSKTFLVSSRRNFSIDPLTVSDLSRSPLEGHRNLFGLSDFSTVTQQEMADYAKAFVARHPEEDKIMNFYKQRPFEPIAGVRDGYLPFENNITQAASDIPASLKNLDILCGLKVAKRK